MRGLTRVVLGFVVMGGQLGETLAQDPSKPDPSPSLNALDSRDLRGFLNAVLNRFAVNPGADAVFASQSDLSAFLADAQKVVDRSSRGIGRSVTTRTLGDNVLSTVNQIASAAQTSGTAKISASDLAVLTGRTSLLLASVVFDGERVLPSAQAPSKSLPAAAYMPPAPSKAMPRIGATAQGPGGPSIPSKGLPPQTPAKSAPPSS